MEALQLHLIPLIRLATVALTVAMLWWGREFLMPLAMAALLTFLLTPVVSFFKHRLRFSCTLAVITVTLLSFSFLGSVFWALGLQLRDLAEELPSYRTTIQQRISSLREVGNNRVLERLSDLARDVSGQASQPDPGVSSAPAEPPVFIERSTNKLQETVMSAGALLADSLGTAAVVVVFVIFMLLRQQDLRNRVIHLVGYSRLTTTTRALDEAASRVSRYLLMQTLINTVYGLMLGLGFWLIGLPYVVLWGALAAIFRFVPYIGPWIAAILPTALSLVVFDGWTQPLFVITLIASLELLTNMILEPMLYGHSAGVSDIALLIAILFWTWVWGSVGLLLATPLTVCLVVFCKYIPEMHFVEVLMGEKPQVQPSLLVFQRLLVGDVEEAESFVQNSVRERGAEPTIDQVLLPAAVQVRREMLAGRLNREETESILGTLSELADEAEPNGEDLLEPPPSETRPLLLCRSFDASADAIALRWLERRLAPGFLKWESIPKSALVSEVIEQVERLQPRLVCISAVPPGVSSQAQILCKRLRHRFPELQILLARWGGQTAESTLETGASWVVTTTEAARERLTEALRLDRPVANEEDGGKTKKNEASFVASRRYGL
ncbi:Predicted PurR-regulated permease PerM [Prosthecobacter debontii]|uniref:Predicted PurR-regulated permease PerM n=1 Tax=Prosthecobacter debontii TaxID=48467 RepID=A0A1T4WIS5_9BACT|nr:AI-2E family transporter [Prosthecobacter debontii]SKA77244.1 Predicted PurR-regulated permease PerM [Prosthecobacter debontii]